MKNYQIGDICKLLNIKAHVLRYWEQEMSFLSPRKDSFGKRIYSQRDIELLFRIKYLLHEKRYTIEGARNKIWEEIQNSQPDIKASLSELRAELVNAAHKISRYSS